MTSTTISGVPADDRRAPAEEVIAATMQAARLARTGPAVRLSGDGLHLDDPERPHQVTWKDYVARAHAVGLDVRDSDATSALLTRWVDSRPVSDAEAHEHGLAALRWDGKGRPRWTVSVLRSGTLTDWFPTLRTTRDAIQHARAGAWDRSQELLLIEQEHGDLTSWTHPLDPRLGSAVLTRTARPRDAVQALVASGRRPLVLGDRSALERVAASSGQAVWVGAIADVAAPRWVG